MNRFAVKAHETSKSKLSLLVYLFLLGLIAPPDISIYIGDVRLSIYRVILIAAILPIIYGLLSGRIGGIKGFDVFVFFYAFWAAGMLLYHHGITEGWQPSGIFILEAAGSYLIARLYIRSASDVQNLTRFVFGAFVVITPFVIYESISGDHLLRNAIRSLFGGFPVGSEIRWGLTRAYGPFDHPILLGVFSASFFAPVFYALGGGLFSLATLSRCGLIIIATFTSLSSAPFLVLGWQLILVVWDCLTRRINRRWIWLGALVAGAVGAVALISNRPVVNVIIWYLTFNPHTGYTRLKTWEYGTAQVARHPFVGVGLNDWDPGVKPEWLTSSVDNFWLVEAFRYGIPAVVFLGAAIVLLTLRNFRLRSPNAQTDLCRRSWIFTISAFIIAGATVHFWNAVFCLFMFVLGSGAWIGESEKTAKSVARAMTPVKV